MFFPQRVLVALGRTDEALVVAERGRTRAFVDLLVERQQMGPNSWYHGVDSTPVTKEMMLDIVARQKAAVLYFSIAAGYLYSWLITPDQGTKLRAKGLGGTSNNKLHNITCTGNESGVLPNTCYY